MPDTTFDLTNSVKSEDILVKYEVEAGALQNLYLYAPAHTYVRTCTILLYHQLIFC